MDYVPAGTYTLEVTEGADTEPMKKKPGSQGLLGGMLQMASVHTVKSYEDGEQSVIVGATDVTGVSVELKESKTVKKDFDINDLLSAPKS